MVRLLVGSIFSPGIPLMRERMSARRAASSALVADWLAVT